jgi:CPA2 family monovalent cation:H+ antiporter-2
VTLAAESGGPQGGLLLVEFGGIVVCLALLARAARWADLSPIPLYLLTGLAFGAGGLHPLVLSESFTAVGAELGVVLLLFMLGLEYSASEFRSVLRAGAAPGALDVALNFTPGLVAGIAFGWAPAAAVMLGGVTYVSSSGVIAKALADLDRLGNRETPAVLSLLVTEDLVMVAYLAMVAALVSGGGAFAGAVAMVAALGVVAVVLLAALRFGDQVSQIIASPSDEVILLTVLGLVLLTAGVAQRLQVSGAVGAFLIGVALSGEAASRARLLLAPLRDLFAGVFFAFFGLQIDPASLPPVLGPAVMLAVVTAITKVVTGWYAARRIGVRTRGRFRAGMALVARGEFSIVIAALAAGPGAGVEPELGPLTAAYVLLLAVAGPMLMRVSDPLVEAVVRRAENGRGKGAPRSP